MNTNLQIQQLHSHQTLRTGQIIQGEILKLYPQNKAQIQLGNKVFVANLETALNIGEKYYFQVKIANNTLYLKVINKIMKDESKNKINHLLKNLGIKVSKERNGFVLELMRKGIPFDKKQLMDTLPFVDQIKKDPVIQDVLEELILRKLPINRAVFESIYTYRTNNQSTLIQKILGQMNVKDPTNLEIQNLLQELITKNSSVQPKDAFLNLIHKYLNLAGLDYENQLAKEELPQQNIKLVLLNLLKKSVDSEMNIKGEKLLHYLNGMKIVSVNNFESYLHIHFKIPGEGLRLTQDIELHFESRKKENNQIDPDYCRILLFLDLKNIHDTIVDMNIQSRSISLTIYNDTDQINDRAKSYYSLLKKGLINLNYQLSSISFHPLEKRRNNRVAYDDIVSPMKYRGVDYQI